MLVLDGQAQLEAYKLAKQIKMPGNEGNFNNPLKYWAGIEHQSPELSQLTKEFLSIPATSALSERVWSRATRVIRAKRGLDPDITARMMFALYVVPSMLSTTCKDTKPFLYI